MKAFWWMCAVLGAVVPYIFFLQFFAEHGVALTGFLGALFANGAAGGFAADIFISSFVFWAWIWQAGARGGRLALIVLVNLSIGLSCALPLYLALREEPLHANA